MFWKAKKGDPDSVWKEQHDAQLTNPLYSFINIQKIGTLIDLYKRTYDAAGTKALEAYIRKEIEPFLYNKGQGQIVDENEFREWKLEKMRKKNPGIPLTAVDIKLFDDDFNKFQPHEACWDIKKRGTVGETILHLCLVGDSEVHLAIANILLEMYPKMALDFYEGDEYYGESGLHLAIVNGNFEMVRLLVENGADVNQRATGRFFLPEDQKNGRTKNTNYEGYAYYGEYPLAFAACFGRDEIYDYLMDHGADPNFQDSFGNTVLHMMVICNQLRMLGYAVKHHYKKADMEIRNNANLTALTLASKLGRNSIFKEFIELQSIEIWRYSNVTCSTYPLGPLDTIGKEGKTNWSAALIYLTEGESEDHLDMLAGGVIKQLLSSKWNIYARRRFFERLILAVLHLIVLSIAIYTRPSSDDELLGQWDRTSMVRYVSEIIVCIACLSNLLFQMEEIRSQGFWNFLRNQTSAPAKLLFNVSCLLILMCIPMRFLKYGAAEMVLLSMAVPCAWAFLLFFARGIPLTGPFVIMIYKMCASDMVRFVIIFVVFLIQFSQGFFFLFKDIDNPNISTFKSIDGTIMQLFQMTLGDFKYDEFDQTRIPILTKAVFAVFALLVPILLLNMLIAMMGNTYAMVISRSEKEWKRQWAKIIIVLERTFSPKQLQMYQGIYSSELSPGSDARGLIVIKTERKTKARQRKGAIANWKKLVAEIKSLIKEARKKGKSGPIDLESDDLSETLTQRQMKKRQKETEGSTSVDDGSLMTAMSQLAWEKDIDLTKGKAFIQEKPIKEEPGTPSTRGSSAGDKTPLLKTGGEGNVKSGLGTAKTGTQSVATSLGSRRPNSGEKQGETKFANPKMHTAKVHPDEGKSSDKGKKFTTKASGRASSGGSKDSAFLSEGTESRTGRRTTFAITGSRSSLNSASSLSSLLHAGEGKGLNKKQNQNDSTEF